MFPCRVDLGISCVPRNDPLKRPAESFLCSSLGLCPSDLQGLKRGH